MSADRVIPVLVYRDIQAAHDFLVNALGFESVAIDEGADGLPAHATVRCAGTEIWLHHEAAQHRLASPQNRDLVSSGMLIFVDDVDVHFERARKAGAECVRPPANQPSGHRECEIWDPEGHRWWFAQARPADD